MAQLFGIMGGHWRTPHKFQRARTVISPRGEYFSKTVVLKTPQTSQGSTVHFNSAEAWHIVVRGIDDTEDVTVKGGGVLIAASH